ncbi:uncharacterized protein I206_104736 [Kwoniella pini CBS 10737]|uniref:Uncharacterized protein n=1 Tax=Kwoniella pini CBS 10737 TaxID=1296096 RepID=A0A1B9I7U2_9TREE|nr:uncharacterized protein I206_02274 [Kwoniella pini CBS 10737]OCF51559.1 hypothetical protein I206_02274 [Kwoniella pini CBS 10737]
MIDELTETWTEKPLTENEYSPSSPASSSSSNGGYQYDHKPITKEKRQRKEMKRLTSKSPYPTEFRERQGSESEQSIGPYDNQQSTKPRMGFFSKLFSCSCFEFDDSDPVARYRPKHEAIFGKNPVYKNHQIQPQNENQAKMIFSEKQAPNSFAGGTTGGSGTGGGYS